MATSFVGYGKIAHGTCKGPEEAEWCVTEKVPWSWQHQLGCRSKVFSPLDTVSGKMFLFSNRLFGGALFLNHSLIDPKFQGFNCWVP